ncbi:MAG: biopolymer transporter ExbD [Bacteroidales bacterium]|nr:biopolymer transporter ExbD [Bacteroidales bacterium]
MARFKQKNDKGTPGLNMGSMSDIIFMLLFFFMVITTMRESELFVKITPPKGSEVTKLEKKSLVSYINIGVPMDKYTSKYGTEPRIQLNDQISEVEDIRQFVELEKSARSEEDSKLLTFAIKSDGKVKMGTISDIKQELRTSSALKIFYNAAKDNKR